MVHQHFINFTGGDFFPATVDDFFQAACNPQISFIIKNALIAGPEPSIGEGFGVRRGVVAIATENILATDNDLTGLSGGEQFSVQ